MLFRKVAAELFDGADRDGVCDRVERGGLGGIRNTVAGGMSFLSGSQIDGFLGGRYFTLLDTGERGGRGTGNPVGCLAVLAQDTSILEGTLTLRTGEVSFAATFAATVSEMRGFVAGKAMPGGEGFRTVLTLENFGLRFGSGGEVGLRQFVPAFCVAASIHTACRQITPKGRKSASGEFATSCLQPSP